MGQNCKLFDKYNYTQVPEEIAAPSSEVKKSIERPKSAVAQNKSSKETAAKPEKLTASNLKKFDRQAPGPADLFPESQFTTKKYSIAPLPKTKPRVESEKVDPVLLYPKYDVTRPNHSPAVVYRDKHKLKALAEERLSERSDGKSFASTAVTSTLSKQGVSFAPKQYTCLTDDELEKLLRYKFKQQSQHVPAASIVSYKVVEPEVKTKRIVNKKTIRKDAAL